MYALCKWEVPVLIEVRFHSLVRQVCDLLDCHGAHLLLGCSEPALRHPLLDLHSVSDYHAIGSYGSADVAPLLHNEYVRGLCDLAMQTEQMQSLNAIRVQCGSILVQSIAVAPLKRSEGIFGLLLLLDQRPDTFARGEHVLLDCYLPSLVQQLERELYGLNMPLHERVQERFTGRNKKLSLLGSADREEMRVLEQRISEDVQELAQVSQRLEVWQHSRRQAESDAINSEFLSMVMHELRTPLTAIKGYAGLLQAYRVSNPAAEQEIEAAEMTLARQQRYLDTIMEQAVHLEVLVGDLLDISRIHAGRLALRCAPVDIVQLCQRVVELVQHRVNQQEAGAYEIRFLSDTLPTFLPVWADPDRVQQVLTNLLDNAVKYSPGGGRVEVQISALGSNDMWGRAATPLPNLPHGYDRPRGMMWVTVRDYGIGIPQEQQGYLFKPFHRLEHSLTGDVPGAGLGLYITRKLIEAMKGQIALESRAGEGTCVMFTLPLHKDSGRNSGRVDREVESVISC